MGLLSEIFARPQADRAFAGHHALSECLSAGKVMLYSVWMLAAIAGTISTGAMFRSCLRSREQS